MANIQVVSREQLEQKVRGKKEELLLQSLQRFPPSYWSGVKVAEGCLYGAFRFHEGQNGEHSVGSAAFLLGEEGLILVAPQGSEGLPWQAASQAVEDGMEAFFESILIRGQQKVEKMERYLIEVEQEIVKGKINRNRNQVIFECKRTLSIWKNDYVQFLNIVEGINGLEQKKKEGEGQILTEESACYFHVYGTKLKRLTEETQFLYEELVHIREALDAALSYEQNRIMKVFTTVTTVFMPLSLIAGWYGMNFAGMPELEWEYGYAFVGVLSVLVILACIWFFKKKKLF